MAAPLVFQFARLRIWSVRHRHAGPPLRLLIRRALEAEPEVRCYLSNAAADRPVETMALVTGSRGRREAFFAEAKGQLTGDVAVRGPLVDEFASPHEPGGAGASVCHAGSTGFQRGTFRN